jgi:hypothetical protein
VNGPDAADFDNDDAGKAGRGYGVCAICGTEWQGFRICHCATCHLTFTAVGGFDAHRAHGRCANPDQLRAKGYEPNDAGHWRIPAPEGTRFSR